MTTPPTAEQARQAWDKATGLVSEQQENISYVKELLFSPWNKLGWIGTLILVALLALFGVGILVFIPLLAWFLFQTLSVLYIPSARWYQQQVQARKRAEQREKTRDLLLIKLIGEHELDRAAREGVDGNLSQFMVRSVDIHTHGWQYAVQDFCAPYLRMRDRLEAMKKLAESSDTAMSEREVDELENATLDYLRLAYSLLNVHDRLEDDQSSRIVLQIEEIEEQLENESLPLGVRRQLEKVRARHEGILQRRDSLPARKITMAAQLTAMAEAFEELYHRFTADPSANISDFLDETTSRLSIEEQLTVAAVEAGTDNDLQQKLARVAAKARAQQAG